MFPVILSTSLKIRLRFGQRLIGPVFFPALIIEPAEPEVEEGNGEKKEGEEGEIEGYISRAEDVASVNKEEELALPEVIIKYHWFFIATTHDNAHLDSSCGKRVLGGQACGF